MSQGIGAHANKILEDNKMVIYEYGGYNLNNLMKMPSDRKKLVKKRIQVLVDYVQMLEKGLIKVENSSNCWMTTDDDLNIDVMVCHLLFKLFYQYQEEGNVPEHVSYNV